MKRIYVSTIAALATVFILLAGCGDEAAAPTDPGEKPVPRHSYLAGEHHDAKWSYEGKTGPAYWASLDPAWSVAKNGKFQSPIDVVSADVVKAHLPVLEFEYGMARLALFNNGHTVQQDIKGGSHLEIAGKRFRLKQFHMHTPSEHTFDGKHADLELHLVHEAADGEVAVVAVFGNVGSPDPERAKIAEDLPTKSGEHVDFQLKGLLENLVLPDDRSYLTYSGSFTTPPCTEGVRWILLTERMSLDPTVVARIRTAEKHNNRPAQPLHGRTVRAGR